MDGAPPFHPNVTLAIEFMAATGLPMRPMAHSGSFYTLDDPIYDARYQERKAALRAGEDAPYPLNSLGLPHVMKHEMDYGVDEGLMRQEGDRYYLTPSGWAHAEQQKYSVTADELDAAEAALEQVEPRTPLGQQYANYLLGKIGDLRRDTRRWKKPKGGAISRPAMVVLTKMAEADKPIERRPGGFWCIEGSDCSWSTVVQTIRSLEKKGLLQRGEGPDWKAPRTLTAAGAALARGAGEMTARWDLTRADAAELADWLSQASDLWLASAPMLSGDDRRQFEVWAQQAGRLAAKLGPACHYLIDDRELRRYNDPEGRTEAMAFHGGYDDYSIEIVPLSEVDIPEVWNPGRFETAMAHLIEKKPMDPIHASKSGDDRWSISDGIHRSNASVALGYTHIPVLTSTFVPTPEAYVPEDPEKPRLQVGDWVKLHKAFRGSKYGWVSERLHVKAQRGAKRFCYGIALVQKGSEWPSLADHCDDEFEPTKPPAWARKVRADVESQGWQDAPT